VEEAEAAAEFAAPPRPRRRVPGPGRQLERRAELAPSRGEAMEEAEAAAEAPGSPPRRGRVPGPGR
jgi:hypothetical protein